MPILDQFGRPFENLKKPDTREVSVVSIRDRYSMYPSEGLTPQKLAQIFKEADQGDVYRQAELFEEMEEKDTHLSAELLKRKNAVNSLDFDIVPYEQGTRTSVSRGRGRPAKSDKVTDFCRDAIFSLTEFEDSLFDILDAIGKGFSASWIKWEIAEKKAVIASLTRIHQKRLNFTQTLVPRLITDENQAGEDIKPFQVVYHRHKARSGYDTRAGMLRVCAWMYLFKNYSIKDWVAFAEIFGMPLRLGKYDSGAGKEDKDALVAAIRSLGSDAAGIISKNTEIEFVETMKNSGTQNIYEALAGFCNREMSKAIVGATLTTEVGDRGSYAASKTHNDVRLDLVKSDSWSLANTLRMQILRPLVGFNFGWDVPVPWFRLYLQEPEDLKVLSEVYGNVIGFGQPVAAEHVSERFGIPLPEKGETVLQGQKADVGDESSTAKRRVAAKLGPGAKEGRQTEPSLALEGKVAASLKSEQFTPEQEEIEDLAEQSLGEAAAAMRSLDAPIRRMIENARSLEEIRDRILELYKGMDGGDLEKALAEALVTAALHGLTAETGK